MKQETAQKAKQEFDHFLLDTQNQNISCFLKTNSIDPDVHYLHYHDGYEVLFLLQGEIDMQFENSIHTLHRGDILMIPPYVMHFARQRNPEEYRRYMLNFKDHYMNALLAKDEMFHHITDCFYQARGLMIHADKTELIKLSSLAALLQRALEAPSEEFGNDLLVVSLLSIILVELNRLSLASPSFVSSDSQTKSRKFPEPVQEVFHYVEQNLDRKFYVTDIAGHVHLNSIYLARLFRQYTGITIQEYIIEKRLAKASSMLRDGQSPTDVAFSCGLGNYSNFSRTFKSHFKISPKQYQLNSRSLLPGR